MTEYINITASMVFYFKWVIFIVSIDLFPVWGDRKQEKKKWNKELVIATYVKLFRHFYYHIRLCEILEELVVGLG